MEQYYNNQPSAATTVNESSRNPSASVLSKFDKHCKTLLAENADKGWASELCCYLGSMKWNVTKETDLVEWWQVRNKFLSSSSIDRNSVEPCTIIPNTHMYCSWYSQVHQVLTWAMAGLVSLAALPEQGQKCRLLWNVLGASWVTLRWIFRCLWVSFFLFQSSFQVYRK